MAWPTCTFLFCLSCRHGLLPSPAGLSPNFDCPLTAFHSSLYPCRLAAPAPAGYAAQAGWLVVGGATRHQRRAAHARMVSAGRGRSYTPSTTRCPCAFGECWLWEELHAINDALPMRVW